MKRRLQIEEFTFDLAAHHSNTVAGSQFWTEEDNALLQSWGGFPGWCWCNPPYANIRPWVEKAVAGSAVGWGGARSGSSIAMLVPASVGSNWWAEAVDGRAHVLFLNGRLTFAGETTPYPKDTALLLYTPFIKGGYEVWRWKD